MDGPDWQREDDHDDRCLKSVPLDGFGSSVNQRSARLARAIEFEIIPRLLLAHRVTDHRVGCAAVGGGAIQPSDVESFVRQILLPDEAPAIQCIVSILERAVPIEAIYLNLLAPAARRLGDLWLEDLCDFTEVTIALGRLQRILRELASSRPAVTEADVPARILLLPSPGEQHTFGLIMVGEFFRSSGWQVVGGSWSTGLDAPGIATSEWYDAAGFSLAAEIHLDALEQVIAAVRRASANPDIVILVGGPLFSEHPDWVQRVGADATASNGREAPVVAKQWLARVRDSSRRLSAREPGG